MRVSEAWWYAALHFRRPRTLQIGFDAVRLSDVSYPFAELRDVRISQCRRPLSWLGWRRVHLVAQASSEQIGIDRVSSAKLALHVAALVRPLLMARLDACATHLNELSNASQAVYRRDRYVRASQAATLSSALQLRQRDLELELAALKVHRMLPKDAVGRVLGLQRQLSDQIRINEPEHRRQHNRDFLARARVEEADYFSKVESQPLTPRQIDAALVFEDANLTVAAAGSGKSSCIVAKIGYALKTGMFADHEVVALAFNREAADQLAARTRKRLSKQLERKVNVASKTFHSLGLATMVKCKGEGYRPKVLKEEKDEEGRLIASVLSELADHSPEFQKAVADWMLVAPFDEPQLVGRGADLTECERRYERACKAAIKFKVAPKGSLNAYGGSIPTFDLSTHVRSLQERSIVNWLLLRGVSFEYEKADWDGGKHFGLKSKSGKIRPYTPDFTYVGITQRGGKPVRCRVVHEHFGLDEHGRAPEWMGGDAYVMQAASKRRYFQVAAQRNATAEEPVLFFETRSSQFQNGTVFERLEKQLKDHGVQLQAPREEIRKRALESFREFNDLESQLNKFVLAFKESGLSKEEVRGKALRSASPHPTKLFLDVAFRLFDGYQRKLKDLDLIDYADMLREAVGALRTRQVLSPYRLVLVDEFQDISRLRANLVKSILDQAPETSIVFCVGDDWQTINRFAGSDVEVFKNAGSYFNREIAMVHLGKTFRCPQGIADVAKSLVMQNVGQIDKEVVAHDSTVSGTVRVVEHGPAAEDRRDALVAQLHWIAERTQGTQATAVYILRRTTNDKTAPEGLDTEYLEELAQRFAPKLKIEERSVHSSKGLEADYVILPGLDSGFAGFPDERAPQQMLELVLPPQGDPLEGERRLFYVGLTRAIRTVIVLTDARRPSEFIQSLARRANADGAVEWLKWDGDKREPCPRCRKGSMVPGWGGEAAKWMVCSRSFPCGYRHS